jgi:hypothetical protein
MRSGELASPCSATAPATLFNDDNLTAAPAELILPDNETFFNELIDRAYLYKTAPILD